MKTRSKPDPWKSVMKSLKCRYKVLDGMGSYVRMHELGYAMEVIMRYAPKPSSPRKAKK